MARAVVLGAGVVGAATAIAAAAAGFETKLIAERRLSDPDAASDPRFASAFAAASIVPHHVHVDNLGEMFALSMRIFDTLRAAPDAGVDLRPHYEIWEEPAPLPAYAPYLRDRVDIADLDGETLPRRPGAPGAFGYRFNALFADLERYRPWLDALLARAGAAPERMRLTPQAVADLQADVIFNCLGAGAHEVFPELPSGGVLRGLLLRFKTETPVVSPTHGGPISYNYTPTEDVFASPRGGPGSLYFYPRRDSCIFGGVVQPGVIDPVTGAFEGAPLRGDTIDVNGAAVPRAMAELNAVLAGQLTTARPSGDYEVLVGYRYIYGTPESHRIHIAKRALDDGRVVIDCLGFAGGGVTLSWGGAAEAVALAMAATDGARLTAADVLEADLLPALNRWTRP